MRKYNCYCCVSSVQNQVIDSDLKMKSVFNKITKTEEWSVNESNGVKSLNPRV